MGAFLCSILEKMRNQMDLLFQHALPVTPSYRSDSLHPLSELHSMACSPFQVHEDAAMVYLIDSVQQYGVLLPAEVRPRSEGG